MAQTNTFSQITHAQFSQWVLLEHAEVLVCRRWALPEVMGKSSGIGYIFSTNRGVVIQGEACLSDASKLVCCLVEGRVYRLRRFSVLPRPASMSFSLHATASLLLLNCTLATPMSCTLDGFIQFPFSPMAIEDISNTQAFSLIDVIGMVGDVGVSRPAKKGGFIVDCTITSALGTGIRTTLWNEAAGDVPHYQQSSSGGALFVFTGMEAKDFRGEVYLSSTRATIVHTSDKFLAEATAFMAIYCENRTKARAFTPPHDGDEDHSLTQLLYMGRALHLKEMKESVTLKCKVKVVGMRREYPWFRPICSLSSCQKGVVAIDGVFWCEACERLSHYAPPGFRIYLNVSDGMSMVMVSFLNEVAEALLGKTAATIVEELGPQVDSMQPPTPVLALANTHLTLELKSHTYFDFITHESFCCSKVIVASAADQLPVVIPPTAMPDQTAGNNEAIGTQADMASEDKDEEDAGY